MSATDARHDDADTDSSIAAYLAQHPRMMGIVFTALMLLMQAGSAAAGASANLSGP